MSSYRPVTNIEIKADAYLLEYIQKQCREKQIKFISNATNKSILKLRTEADLHYQAELLNNLWKQLLSDAIIFLKKKDNRELYHDRVTMGTEKLCDFLNEFQKFEPILYGSVPNYRDHIAHVLRVYFLGQYLIENAIGFENISFSRSDFVSPPEKEAMWCIIALTHDLGVSLEKVHDINQKVRSMLQKFGNIPVQEIGYSYFAQFGAFSEFAVKFMSSDVATVNAHEKRAREDEKRNEGREKKPKEEFTTRIQSKYYQKLLAALGNFNHGVMSSIILMKDLVYFKESDYKLDQSKYLDEEDARQFMIRREILRAIAAHSCDDIYHLTIRNFPFLLTVCDEMQEWGRPRLVDVFKRGETSTKLTINKFDGETVDYRVTFYFREDSKASEEERKNAKREVMRYCLAKREKWLNVLRSAVGGDLRKLTLNFEVEDASIAEIETYTLHHPNPRDVKMTPINEELGKRLVSD
jgi:hypothetical protein